MKHIEIVKTSHASTDVFIDGEKQEAVIRTECWFDTTDMCMKFLIHTLVGQDETYAQVFSDFTLVYRSVVPDDDYTVTHRGRVYELNQKLVRDGFTIGKLWQQGWTLDGMIASNLLVLMECEAERLLEIKKLAHDLVNNLCPDHCSPSVRDAARRLYQALLP